jgi:phage virion morphogenesis protein
MKVTVEINDRQVNAAFRKLTQAGTNLRPILTSIGEAMVESTKLRFRDSQAPDGGQWAPLSPVTIALRRQGSSKPLLDTGRLRNSITRAVGVRDVVIGTNVIYAGTHQFGARKGQYGRTRRGAPIPWGNVPARPFFGMSRGDKAEIMTILRDALTP